MITRRVASATIARDTGLLIAAGLLENNTEQLRRWIRDPGSVKPGNKMTLAYARKGQDGKPIDGIKLTTEEEVALAAYLESLK